MPKKILPPVYFLAALVLMVALHFLLPLAQIVPAPYRYLGAAPIVAGLLVNLWADGCFKRFQTTIKPFQESSHLVETGPYRYSRNPMYVGLVLMLLGAFLLLGSLGPIVILPAFVWLITTRFIAVEEQMLATRFGDAYRQYQARVRRWL